MNEKQLENKIKNYLKENDHYYVKVHGNGVGKVGVPDIIACVYGLFVGLEIKAPNGKGKVTKLQQYNLDKIKESKGVGLVIDKWEDFYEFMESIKIGNIILNEFKGDE